MSALDALAEAYAATSAAVDGLAPRDLLRPTGAESWCVADLLLHLRLDAERALVACTTTADDEPDVDAVTYWTAYQQGKPDDGGAHARFVRVSAAAYASPAGLVQHWSHVSGAALRALAARDPDGRVSTQGHVLRVEDFTATLAVEGAVHHLDLTLELPQRRHPLPLSLALTREVVTRAVGPLPARWSDVDAALRATGRAPLDDADRAELGAAADRLPLFS
ncbi:mycothiol maleylpyruvate isomerase-like protein [Motilibacter rhizosphaerae]|uniref:Mycothiol maleylpyruvate isomerase-like protein n=1 Tax=Motilibacter rhizosphaerae TaxID=598652 RepID=A0A4Q7NZD0_9ACTN|nr:maleylpyruvate isomerase N-terminal domain-containing protein [Motilibacter rhizosphaerae]RZS91792.1 mycothiol maleylpyruvate isomerase-like protein [Motilibacter rhizosphaerae]